LTRPDPAAPPGGDDGPVFAEPWQAEAFALAVSLNERGLIAWSDWAEALAAELRAAGAADDGVRYYEHWLAALERIATERGFTDAAELEQRKAAWADAYRRTPHGKPISL